MRALVTRVDRIARGLAPAAGVHVWVPADDELDDGRVRDLATGATIARADIDRRPGRHIPVQYVEGSSRCG